MNILLLGYGKMGKAIEQLAIKRGHTIVAKVDDSNKESLQNISADVAIEFSQPDAAPDNIRYCLTNGIPILSGTTGWLEQKKELDDLCYSKNGTFFYASNYSLGVNIFFKLNEKLAEMMNSFEGYEVSIDEIHHTQKKDAPSGTGISIAEGIINKLERKKKWSLNKGKSEEIAINAYREGEVPGTHTVTYHSSIDDIEIKHTAHSREGFVKGAVLVAEWLKDQKGVLNMDDFLKF